MVHSTDTCRNIRRGGGKFTVEYAGQRTGYLAYATSAAAMKTALEQLSTIGTVDVTRSDKDENKGYV